MYNPYDFYFKEAKKKGFKARSVFKLEEIDQKFKIFDKNTKTILDIGCAPGSWTQFVYKRLNELKVPANQYKIVGFDIKDVKLNLPGVFCFNQDITNLDEVNQKLNDLQISKFDVIISDMAPNTIGFKDIDAIRSIGLLEKTLPIYEHYLKDDGKIVIKIFMGPGFEEFVKTLKNMYGAKSIKVFKPKACRTESKETYIVKS